jgi:hypothetical protein
LRPIGILWIARHRWLCADNLSVVIARLDRAIQ